MSYIFCLFLKLQIIFQNKFQSIVSLRKPSFDERLSVTMVESVTLGILLKKIRPSILALADKVPGYGDVNWE